VDAHAPLSQCFCREDRTSDLINEIVADADGMTDRMGGCDRKIEIVLQSIEQRHGQVEMHCLGDRRGYHDLLADPGRAQPDRTGFRYRLLAESCSSAPYETVFVAGNNQANLHMLRNNRRRFNDPMKSELHG
jgi:hypothetical protein